MALLQWEEDEKKKQEEMLTSPIKSVQSVQSTWQPVTQADEQETAPDGTLPAQNENYLLSEQKAQIDQQKRERDAAEAEAAARAAEMQRQAAAARAMQAEQDQTEVKPLTKALPQKGKFSGGNQKKGEGFFIDALKNIGSGIQQGAGAVADIAIQGGGLIGTIGKNDKQIARELENVNKVRGWLHNMKDFNGNAVVGTRDVEQQATRIASGKGDVRDFLAVGGKGLQAGIDSTFLLSPARLAQGGLTPVRDALKFAGRDAAFYGGLQGGATTASTYGQGEELDEALRLGAQDALIGAALQGTLDLSAQGVNQIANRTVNSLRGGDRFKIGDEAVELIEDGVSAGQKTATIEDGAVTPVQDNRRQTETQDSNVSFQPVTQEADITQSSNLLDTAAADVTPVADGVAQPVENVELTPVNTVENSVETPAPMTPEAQPEVAPVVADGTAQAPAPAPVDPIKQEADRVRELQDARAGASQAEEAAINQELQEIEDSAPKYKYKSRDGNSSYNELNEKNSFQDINGNVFPVGSDAKITIANYQGTGRTKTYTITDIANQKAFNNALKKYGESGDIMSAIVDDTPVRYESPIAQARREMKAQNISPVTKAGRSAIIDRKNEIMPSASGDLPVVNRRDVPQNNLPDDMGVDPVPVKPIDLEKENRKSFANVISRSTDSNSDMNTRLNNAVGLSQETGVEVKQVLEDAGIVGDQARRIETLFDRAAEIAESNKQIQKQSRKSFIKEGIQGVDEDLARTRNRETDEAIYVRGQLNSELKKLERKGDFGEKLVQGLENVISGKNSNQLIGAPIERGLTAEVIGNAMNTVKNPVKQIRGAVTSGIPGKSAVKRLVRDIKTPPKTVTEGYKYLIGNTYRAAMTPAQALADSRKGAFRTELTRYAYSNKIGKELSSKEAEKVSRMAGNDMEALVNMGAGVDNGTINILSYRRALKNWKKFIETGSEADYSKYMDSIDRQTSIVDRMAQGFSTEGKNRLQRAGLSVVNLMLPYMRNAVNMSTKGVLLDLNPFTMSLVDGIRKDQRGFMNNLALGIKNKTVDYAVLAALGSVLVYNDGSDPDDVEKPRGVSIALGGDDYFAIRGTPLELPLGAIMVAKQLAEDGIKGEFRNPGHYTGMITPSIPYVDYMASHGNLIDSIEKIGTEASDDGYAVKNFLISNAKSLTPFSNNNIEASLSRFGEDQSLTAKTTYDKDSIGQSYLNSLANNNLGEVLPFVPKRDELKDSRDAAGRLRTVDNQGSFMRKKINDAGTKEFNDDVVSLVEYARQAKLGNGTKEMFNTYDTGKNNNFKSIQDSITFLDANGSPDPAKKLDKNAKLTDLSRQIRDGFYGDTGSELLTLDGKELKSDVSVPSKDGTKNTKLPMSMQSIKNAIAQTDLPQESWDVINDIKAQKDALYALRKNKEISYEQEQAAKAELSQQEAEVLQGSENYKKMEALMGKLTDEGFFEDGGLGSTKSGQTYLWNSLNALLGSKGATPAANYPETSEGFTPWGRGGRGGSGRSSKAGGGTLDGNEGLKWTPVGKRQMANVAQGRYTPVDIKVKLGSAIKKDRTQNYSDRTF